MESVQMVKNRRSVKLEKAEIQSLKQYRKKFNTEVECALSLGVDRMVLHRVLLVGSGAPETIAKLKIIIGEANV